MVFSIIYIYTLLDRHNYAIISIDIDSEQRFDIYKKFEFVSFMILFSFYSFRLSAIRLFEVVETLGRVHLVTEWIRGGELYNRITQGGPLTESHAAPLYKQLLLAVKHMVNTGHSFEMMG